MYVCVSKPHTHQPQLPTPSCNSWTLSYQSVEDVRHQLSAEQARTLKLEAQVAELNEKLAQVMARGLPSGQSAWLVSLFHLLACAHVPSKRATFH